MTSTSPARAPVARLAWLTVLLAMAAPTRASAQDFVMSGGDLPKAGLLATGYSMGFQATPASGDRTSGTLSEQPFVVSRRYDRDSVGALATLVSGELVSSLIVAPRADITRTQPTRVTLTDALLTGYTFTVQISSSFTVSSMSEQLVLGYSRLAQSSTASTLAPPSPTSTRVGSFVMESSDLSALRSAALSNVLSFSFTLARDPSTDAASAEWRAEPLLMSRRPSSNSDSHVLADFVRTGKVIDELVLVGLAANLSTRVMEIRLRNVSFTQYRVVAATETTPVEQIGIRFGELEIVSLMDSDKPQSVTFTVAK